MNLPCAASDEYAAGWQEYRRLRRNFFLVWFGYIPIVGVLAELGYWIFGNFILGFISAGAYALLFLITSAQWGQFSCPRCGEYFASKTFIRLGPLARKCMHCGLRKWQCNNDR
jgi:hypothetical protein